MCGSCAEEMDHDAGVLLCFIVVCVGRRTDFCGKNRAIFSGELFSGEEFREKHYLSTTWFPLIGCGVDS